MATRIIVALLYAVGLVGTQLATIGTPTTVEAWIGLVVTFLVGFWGKFSSSTTVISPNRAGETLDTQPKTTL